MPNLNIPLSEGQKFRIVAARAKLQELSGTTLTWPEFCDLISADIMARKFKSKI